MKSFMESLIERKFDLSEEILTINYLLDEEDDYSYPLFYYIDKNFKQWHHRSNFTSLGQLLNKMHLNKIINNAEKNTTDIDTFIYFSESIYNLIYVADYNNLTTLPKQNQRVIAENINNVLSQLNYKVYYCESECYYKVVENDWKVAEAAEIIQDKYDLGEKIYLYNHYSLRGKLNDKADILCRLYKVFEGGKEGILKANNYISLASDIGFLSDKLDVRHAPNRQQKILLDGFTSEEQEQWYDDLFNLYLDMLILCDHIEKRKDIKELSVKLSQIKA